MTTFASITAIIVVLHGFLIVLGGFAIKMETLIRSGQRILETAPSGPSGTIIGPLLTSLLFLQGIIMLASGEGLSFLAALIRRMPPS